MFVQLTLTYNRATLLSRALYAFLNQDYEGQMTLLIFNTGKFTELGNFEIPSNKHIILINDQTTEYNSVGAKYTEAIKHLPKGTEIVNIQDDDDYHLSFGVRENIAALLKCGKKAYKPGKSYFHYEGKITLESNNLEGSIFMKSSHIKEHGFGQNLSVEYHNQWLLPLIKENEMFIDPEGCPSFVYDWHTPGPIWKMSGLGETKDNFNLSKLHSNDYGNGILIPSSKHILHELHN